MILNKRKKWNIRLLVIDNCYFSNYFSIIPIGEWVRWFIEFVVLICGLIQDLFVVLICGFIQDLFVQYAE